MRVIIILILSVNIQTGVTHAGAKQGKECQNIPMMGRFKDQMLCGCDEGWGGGGFIGSTLWPVNRGRAKLHLILGGGGREQHGEGGVSVANVIRRVRTCSGMSRGWGAGADKQA